jgi:hypothetical protein
VYYGANHMTSQVFFDYLASGLAADRPVDPNTVSVYGAGSIFPGGIMFWYSSDTGALSLWDTAGAAWVDIPLTGGGGGGDLSGFDTDDLAEGAGNKYYDTADVDSRIAAAFGAVDSDDIPEGTTNRYYTQTREDAVFAAIAASGSGDGASQSSFLVSGGQIVWTSNYNFTVSAASYYINGVLYASAQANITLDAADATNDRIDILAVNDAGAVAKITGTAAAQPSEPDIDPGTQLKLGIVFVAALSTAPAGAVNEVVYTEDAGSGSGEWNWTSSGSGFTLNSTNNPATGTKDIEGTAVTAGSYAQGARGAGTLNPASYTNLVMSIRSKAAWTNKRGLNVTLQLSGVTKGTAVAINREGSFGFSSAITASYQQVAIPLSAFAIPTGTLIDQVRITDFGGSIGFYIDDIYFQSAATPVTQGITQAQADARYVPLSYLDTDTTLAANSDAKVATQKATKTYVDAAIFAAGSYTDEQAQDAVGTILVDGTTVNFTYADATPSITAEVQSIATTHFAAGVIDTDGTLAANSDLKLATQKAVKTYVDGAIPSSTRYVQMVITDPAGSALAQETVRVRRSSFPPHLTV